MLWNGTSAVLRHNKIYLVLSHSHSSSLLPVDDLIAIPTLATQTIQPGLLDYRRGVDFSGFAQGEYRVP